MNKPKFDLKLFWSLPTTTVSLIDCSNSTPCYCAIGAAAKAMGISDSTLQGECDDGFPYEDLPELMKMSNSEMQKVYYMNDFGDADYDVSLKKEQYPNPPEAKKLLLEIIKDRVEFINE